MSTVLSEPIQVRRVLHRRVAYAVNPPAAILHMVFRYKENCDLSLSTTDKNSARRHTLRISRLNTVLMELQRRTEIPEYFAANDETIRFPTRESEDSILRVIPSPPAMASWRLRCSMDAYTEFFTITFIFDQWPGAKEAVGNHKAWNAAASSKRKSQIFIANYYDKIWDNLLAEHVCINFNNRRFPGIKLVEARGLVFSHSLLDKQKQFEKDDIGDDTPIQVDGLRDFLNRNKQIVDSFFEPLCLDQRAPKIARIEWQESDQAGRGPNRVLNKVLDGAGIYGSSLPADKNRAVRYFVFYNGNSAAQLGQFLRQVHVLGELRFAALLDMEGLREADRRIRNLGNEIERQLAISEAGYLSAKKLERLQKELNAISRGEILGDKPNKRIRGGLIYRVNRSRHYASGFKDRLPLVRSQRLLNWESFEDLMHRNLYYHLEYINNIGQRYEALSARMVRLAEVSELEEVAQADKSIHKIQEIGELIGFGALAYYGGRVVATMMADSSLRWFFADTFILAFGVLAVLTVRSYFKFGWKLTAISGFLAVVVLLTLFHTVSDFMLRRLPSVVACEGAHKHLNAELACLNILEHHVNIEALAMLVFILLAIIYLLIKLCGTRPLRND